MSKTIYYIGAGASYGVRDNGKIVEGIPVVKEIPEEFNAFRAYIANAEIPTGEIVFQDIYRTGHDDVENARRYMLHDIDSLISGIKEHATIDTYARKLYLTVLCHGTTIRRWSRLFELIGLIQVWLYSRKIL